ncbi:MAG: ABC-F family ATP-binding cassette domain-containing protein [Treponema sp.]|nr:ABC-F family ATP-binding cassette domain-containing protein [Treponema sp.]
MSFVQFSKVNLAFADRDILKNVSLRLASGSRSCLTGANGSGKSTLMKIIAGKMNWDSGERAVQKDTRICYLPQSGIVHRGKTLRQEVETAYAFVHNLLECLEKKGSLLEKSEEDGASLKVLIEEHHSLQEQIENTGYYRREAEISSVLYGLGFSSGDTERNTGEFSGGWQMRIALAKALLEKPDILLLDEPTNYLDIEARSWLEDYLNKFQGGYLLVSHDKYFLDVCVNEVYELFNGNLKRYAGNYSSYKETRQVELESLIKKYAEQNEEIEKTQALIRRFRYKASKASFAQELVKRLEKMERIEIPASFKKININFPPAPHCGNIALTLNCITKSYGNHHVLNALDLCLDAGERLVVAGPNGAGKSTLLRIIAGEDSDFKGDVKFGTGVKMGYFSQDAAEAMQSSKTVLDFIEEDAPLSLIPKIRDMLGAFLFSGDDVYKSVSVLSGGEKSRLALLKMLLRPVNLLVLDEPTNHLDLYSKDILLDALNKFTGTIIFVSHDRAFMEELSTKTFELSISAVSYKLFYGNYAYYLESVKPDDLQENKTHCLKKSKPACSQDAKEINNEQRRVLDKQKQAASRKLERQEEAILKKLEELETKKNELENELADPLVYSNAQRARDIKRQLDLYSLHISEQTQYWESIALQLEELKN